MSAPTVKQFHLYFHGSAEDIWSKPSQVFILFLAPLTASCRTRVQCFPSLLPISYWKYYTALFQVQLSFSARELPCNWHQECCMGSELQPAPRKKANNLLHSSPSKSNCLPLMRSSSVVRHVTCTSSKETLLGNASASKGEEHDTDSRWQADFPLQKRSQWSQWRKRSNIQKVQEEL